MARARTSSSNSSIGESEQRELIEFEQFVGEQHQRRGREFEVRKSTTLGIIFPQNLQLSVIERSPSQSATSTPTNLISMLSNDWESPNYAGDSAFLTSDLKWWKVLYFLPPSFQIFVPSAEPAPTSPASTSPTASPSSPASIARVKYDGWQGLTVMSFKLTTYSISAFQSNQLDMRSNWTVSRVGYTRHYEMTPSPNTRPEGAKPWVWKGAKRALNAVSSDSHPIKNGNLLLVSPTGRLVAFYKQRRDWDILGGITVLDGTMDEEMSVDTIVASCLGVVMYERIGWQNAFCGNSIDVNQGKDKIV